MKHRSTSTSLPKWKLTLTLFFLIHSLKIKVFSFLTIFWSTKPFTFLHVMRIVKKFSPPFLGPPPYWNYNESIRHLEVITILHSPRHHLPYPFHLMPISRNCKVKLYSSSGRHIVFNMTPLTLPVSTRTTLMWT